MASLLSLLWTLVYCLLLVGLALAERDSKNAGISFFLFFFCQWDLVCRPRVPSGDHGNWG